MMTKREQVRTVKPYRTGARNFILNWEPFVRPTVIERPISTDEQYSIVEELKELFPSERFTDILSRCMNNQRYVYK